MKYTYHVLTPFNRFENLERLIPMLAACPVTWHPIFNDDLPFALHFPQPWIVPGFCPRSGTFWRTWADALNRYIDAGPLDPDARYLVLNDDDWYPRDFFEQLDATEGDVLICSMLRGHHTPPGVAPERAHGTEALLARPENIRVGRVGAEQIITTGRIFERYAFPYTIAGDGERICRIVAEHPTRYLPGAYVWFNFLEPGRWDRWPGADQLTKGNQAHE